MGIADRVEAHFHEVDLKLAEMADGIKVVVAFANPQR